MGKPDIKPLEKQIDPKKCMGKWYVQYGIFAAPFLENGAHNGLENYEWDEAKQQVKVTYTFNEKSFDGKVNKSGQKGRVAPGSKFGTHWNTKPVIGCFTFPVWLDYYIVDVPDDYSYLTACAPGAWWCYIMTREKVVDDATLEPRIALLEKMGVDRKKLVRVPQDGYNYDFGEIDL